jgi:hypothetical protein
VFFIKEENFFLTDRLRKTHPASVKHNKSVEIVCQTHRPAHLMCNVQTNRISSMLTFGFDQLDRQQAFVKKLDAFLLTLYIQFGLFFTQLIQRRFEYVVYAAKKASARRCVRRAKNVRQNGDAGVLSWQ